MAYVLNACLAFILAGLMALEAWTKDDALNRDRTYIAICWFCMAMSWLLMRGMR